LRDKAILEVLYASAIRVGELVKINLNDINLDDKTILINGKGGRERLGLFGETCKKYLEMYLGVRNLIANGNSGNALLLDYRGLRLSARSVERMVQGYLKISGLGKKISPHSFRHSIASTLLSKGTDLRSIQEVLGHISLNTTQLYTHLNTIDLIATHKKYHPRGRR
jgi:integrase/recombinase XerC